jgi:uncharacterized Tic20 family protein
MKQINSKKFRLSICDIIRIIVSLLILGVLLFLKDIFPDNRFVMKYFFGLYGILWIVIFFIIFWRIEIFVAHKRKKGNDRRNQNKLN